MNLTANMTVNPHVRLVEPLGEGSMGCVWIADHLTLNTQVAVKFISDQFTKDNPEIMARFKREASVAAQIKSPHVVQTFDQGEMDDGTPYIVMELLEGESLQERLDRLGPLDIKECAQIVAQIARALRKAHELGVVHRDIKPDNIFTTAHDDGLFCKVLDFGIAKQTQLPKVGGLTNAGLMIGTPEYMSPEQVLSAKDVDHQADLWALSVVAYQLLTGELPFEEETIGLLCVRLLDAQFQPASELRDELGPSVDAWFAQALERDVTSRFADARELALAFVQALPSEAIRLDDNLIHSIGGRGAPMPGPPPTIRGLGPDDPTAAVSAKSISMTKEANTLGETMASHPEPPASSKIATLSGAFASVRPMINKWSRSWVSGAFLATAIIVTSMVVMRAGGDDVSEESKHPALGTMPTEQRGALSASESSVATQPGSAPRTTSSASATPSSSTATAASAAPTSSANAGAPKKPARLRRPRQGPGKPKPRRIDHGF